MESILDAINEWIKEILIGAINGNLSTMFGDVNEKVGTIAAEVGKTPQGWNANIFSMIQNLSENVIVPIAGLVITYVLCYELISMVTEKNNMHDIETFMFFKWFFKAFVAVFLVTHTFSSCGAMFSGSMNSVLGTSYTSEDSDLVATEQSYAAMENELQSEIDNIETTHSGYDEYRYDLDTIGHNPHELASYLTALLQSYTPQSAQAELKRLFGLQYTLTLTEEIEIRTTTDEEGNEEEYEYRILNVKLTNKPIASLAEELLNPQQFEMFKVYLQTQGNKPLIFGGGSPDGSPSEDLSGVEFVNGTRPGNPEFMELAKQQVGNVGGYPYWSWYGFNSRVEWCACFVSWCYNQAGKSEPRFAGCEWQGVPWFQSRGQWGARGYENIAPGDAIFFDWDLDGVADHVGLVLGRDGSRVYTVEGNSGDACKIKSYDLNYQCIKGYGLMNW